MALGNRDQFHRSHMDLGTRTLLLRRIRSPEIMKRGRHEGATSGTGIPGSSLPSSPWKTCKRFTFRSGVCGDLTLTKTEIESGD